MNLYSLIERADYFKSRVVKSGFQRDVQAYIGALGQPQNAANIILLKDTATKTLNVLQELRKTDLSDKMQYLIVSGKSQPFIDGDYIAKLEELLKNTQLAAPQFHSTLNSILNALHNNIAQNEQEITGLLKMLTPICDKETASVKEREEAVIGLVFKDAVTVKHLKKFSLSLARWNRAIHLYSQLVGKETPADVEIVGVQAGSIDVILNIDFNVALDLNEVIKIGLSAFGAYLLYKSQLKDIIKTFGNNQKLIELQSMQEVELLNNVSMSVELKLKEQHKERKKHSKGAIGESVEKKIQVVQETIVDHIVKGNEVLLLASGGEDEETVEKQKGELHLASLSVRNQLKKLDDNAVKLLMEKYAIKDDDEKI